MKKLTLILLIISCYSAFAQKEQKQDTIVYEYNARWYNPSFCGCPPPVKKDSIQVVKDTLKTESIILNKKYKRKKYYNRDISYYVKQKTRTL